MVDDEGKEPQPRSVEELRAEAITLAESILSVHPWTDSTPGYYNPIEKIVMKHYSRGRVWPKEGDWHNRYELGEYKYESKLFGISFSRSHKLRLSRNVIGDALAMTTDYGYDYQTQTLTASQHIEPSYRGDKSLQESSDYAIDQKSEAEQWEQFLECLKWYPGERAPSGEVQ